MTSTAEHTIPIYVVERVQEGNRSRLDDVYFNSKEDAQAFILEYLDTRYNSWVEACTAQHARRHEIRQDPSKMSQEEELLARVFSDDLRMGEDTTLDTSWERWREESHEDETQYEIVLLLPYAPTM